MLISIGDDRVIEAKVKKVEEARQEYNQALKQGHSAAMLQEKTMEDKKEYYVLNLGNIRPGERAIVDLFFQKSLKIVAGSFDFSVPLHFLPKIAKNVSEKKTFNSPKLDLVV